MMKKKFFLIFLTAIFCTFSSNAFPASKKNLPLYKNVQTLNMRCRSFFPIAQVPSASFIDCGRKYVAGYNQKQTKTLWVGEVLKKSQVKKYEKRMGYLHFEEDEEVDPRDFSFTRVPKARWEHHQPLPYKHRLWKKCEKDISAPDDPLGEKRVFNIGPWFHLEIEWRHLAVRFGKIYMASGPMDGAEMEEKAAVEGHLRLPAKIWEAVYIPQKKAVIVHICRNYEPAYCYPSSLLELKKELGFAPFPGLAELALRHEIFEPSWIS